MDEMSVEALQNQIVALTEHIGTLECYLGALVAMLIAKHILTEDESKKILELSKTTYTDLMEG